MELSRKITLPETKEFYTDVNKFNIRLDDVCGEYEDPMTKEKYTLQTDPIMKQLYENLPKTHQVSLNDISRAALSFYRTEYTGTSIDVLEKYENERFMMLYDFGKTYDKTTKESIGHKPKSKLDIPTEATKKTSEMFGYGLAIDFIAHLLGIPLERFVFITSNGARADFFTEVTLRELRERKGIVAALSEEGFLVNIEVRARTRVSKFPKNMLPELAKKSAAHKGQAFIGVLIGLPARTPHEQSKGMTDIVIADPGEPVPLSEKEQVVIILMNALVKAHRYLLRNLVKGICDWLIALGEDEKENHPYSVLKMETALADIRVDRVKYTHRQDGRDIEGYYIEQPINEEEQQPNSPRRLFAGADLKFRDIVRRQDTKVLLEYGVRKEKGWGPEVISAFYYGYLD